MLVRKPPVSWCSYPHHLGVGRKTLDLGVMGGNILPPPPEKVDKEKILSHMFLAEYFSNFIYYSYVKTIFA
jgi:hypothetical protein